MRTSKAVIVLSLIIMSLAVVAASVGLFWNGPDGPETFTTVRGNTIEMYGQGLYRHDSLFNAAGYKGQDAVTLLLGVPLLTIAVWLYRQGSRRGELLLVGTLAYFLYIYVSMAFSAAFNELFLVYVALFSASLFAFVTALSTTNLQGLHARLSADMPRRGPAAFMIASGIVTLAIWLMMVLDALGGNTATTLRSATTMVTHALDIGIITPAAILAGILIWRQRALGYLVAMSLLVVETLLTPLIVAQTIFQLSAGISFTTAEIVGPIAGFVSISLLAIWVAGIILRGVSDSTGA